MPVSHEQPWWMVDLTQPFRSIQYVHFESGALYGEAAMLKLVLQPLDGVRYRLGQPPAEAEDAHLHRIYDLADQCLKAAREHFRLNAFSLLIDFGKSSYTGIEASLELTVTKKEGTS